MIKLSQLKEVRLYGMTISELLDKFQKFEGRDFIFFDTETTGLNPTPEYIQLRNLHRFPGHPGSIFSRHHCCSCTLGS